MKKLMEILGDKRELCRLLNEHKDMLKKVGIVVLVIVLGLVVSAVKNGGQEDQYQYGGFHTAAGTERSRSGNCRKDH